MTTVALSCGMSRRNGVQQVLVDCCLPDQCVTKAIVIDINSISGFGSIVHCRCDLRASSIAE